MAERLPMYYAERSLVTEQFIRLTKQKWHDERTDPTEFAKAYKDAVTVPQDRKALRSLLALVTDELGRKQPLLKASAKKEEFRTRYKDGMKTWQELLGKKFPGENI